MKLRKKDEGEKWEATRKRTKKETKHQDIQKQEKKRRNKNSLLAIISHAVDTDSWIKYKEAILCLTLFVCVCVRVHVCTFLNFCEYYGITCPFKNHLFRILSSSVIPFPLEVQITSTYDGLKSSWMQTRDNLSLSPEESPRNKNSGLTAKRKNVYLALSIQDRQCHYTSYCHHCQQLASAAKHRWFPWR